MTAFENFELRIILQHTNCHLSFWISKADTTAFFPPVQYAIDGIQILPVTSTSVAMLQCCVTLYTKLYDCCADVHKKKVEMGEITWCRVVLFSTHCFYTFIKHRSTVGTKIFPYDKHFLHMKILSSLLKFICCYCGILTLTKNTQFFPHFCV